jgi:hypothetical protein
VNRKYELLSSKRPRNRASLQRHHCGHIHLDQNSRPCRLHDVEERMSRRRRRAENVRTAPPVVGLEAHVGDVAHDLGDISEPGTVLFQSTPDLVVGVPAVGDKVVLVTDIARVAIFRPRPPRRQGRSSWQALRSFTVTASENRPFAHSE